MDSIWPKLVCQGDLTLFKDVIQDDMVKSIPPYTLPSSAELPCSDDTPVDNEDQNFIPNRLLFLLEFIWAARSDCLGVLYYVIHNPEYWQRDRHQPFEVYRLEQGRYQLQIGEPFWMPEVRLGIGRSIYRSGEVQREVLSWYDQKGDRYLTAKEMTVNERQKGERLAAKLRALGIDPDNI